MDVLVALKPSDFTVQYHAPMQVALSALKTGKQLPRRQLQSFLVDATRLAKDVQSQMQSALHEITQSVPGISVAEVPEA
jgi:hypothetical protein